MTKIKLMGVREEDEHYMKCGHNNMKWKWICRKNS